MSIYATLWSIKVQLPDEEWIEVTGQGVPGHIGHSASGDDPFSSFLPPALAGMSADDAEDLLRAVVIVAEGYEEKEGQRYTRPLLTLSGQEYEHVPFGELLERIEHEIDARQWR